MPSPTVPNTYYRASPTSGLFFACLLPNCTQCQISVVPTPPTSRCLSAAPTAASYALIPPAPDGSPACIGGQPPTTNPSPSLSLLALTTYTSANCSTSPLHQPPVVLTVSLLQANECVALANDYASAHQLPSPPNTTAPTHYAVSTGCPSSACNTSQCTAVFPDLASGSCGQASPPGLSAVLAPASPILAAGCLPPTHHHHSLAHLSTRSGIILATTLGGTLLLALLLYVVVRFRVQIFATIASVLSALATAIRTAICTAARGIANTALAFAGLFVRPRMPSKRGPLVALLVALLCACIMLVFELLDNPFAAFGKDAITHLGLPTTDDFDYTQLDAFTTTWHRATLFAWSGFAGLVVLLMVLRLVLRPDLISAWENAAVYAVSTMLLASVALTVVPVLFCPVQHMISVHNTNSSGGDNSSVPAQPPSTSILDNADFRSDINEFVGYSVAGLLFTYVCSLFLWSLHGIPLALMLAAGIFLLCDANVGGAKGWHSPSWRLAVLQRLKISICGGAILFPLATLMPAASLFQIYGADAIWLCCWALLWVSLVASFSHLRAVIDRVLMTPDADGPLSIAIPVLVNLGALVFVFVGISVYLLSNQRRYRDVEALTAVVEAVVSALLSGAVFFLICHNTLQRGERQGAGVAESRGEGGKQGKQEEEEEDEDEPLLIPDALSINGGVGRSHGDRVAAAASGLHSSTAPRVLSSGRTLETAHAPNQPPIPHPAQACGQCLSATGLLLRTLWAWLREDVLVGNPGVFGLRVKYRRLCLWLGFLMFVVEQVLTLRSYLRHSVLDEVQAELDQLGANITWPAGHQLLFNAALQDYAEARWVGYGLQLLAMAALLTAMVLDARAPDRAGLVRSRVCVILASALLFASLVAVVCPNYLEASDFMALCPDCGPEFNHAVQLLVANFVGLLCLLWIAYTIMATQLFVPAFLVRTTAMMLVTLDETKGGSAGAAAASATSHLDETLQLVGSSCVVCTPLLTALPLAVVFQIFTDRFIPWMCVVLWVVPPLVWIGLRSRLGVMARYSLFLLSYTGTVVTMFLLIVYRNGLSTFFTNLVSEVDTWVALVGELCLCLVVVSDALYSCLEHDAIGDLAALEELGGNGIGNVSGSKEEEGREDENEGREDETAPLLAD